MNYFEICLTFLVLLKSVPAKGQEEYPPEVDTSGGDVSLIFKMKRPKGTVSLICPSETRRTCDKNIMMNENDLLQNVSCKEPWSNTFKPGIRHFTANLFTSQCKEEPHRFSVEFKLPVTEIDCDNYINGTIYARKNTTIDCGCHLRDHQFIPAQSRWMEGESLHPKAIDTMYLVLNIEDTQTNLNYRCEGSSRLGSTSLNITDIIALPESYPYITKEETNASNYAVKCDAVYQGVDVVLACKNMRSSGEQVAILRISSQTFKELKHCNCQAKFRNGLVTNSNKSFKAPAITDDGKSDVTKGKDSGDSGVREAVTFKDGEPDALDNNGSNESKDGDRSDSAESEDVDGDNSETGDYSEPVRLPQISFRINQENKTLEIEEGHNMSIDCQAEGPGSYLMTLQRDESILVRKHDKLVKFMEATCQQSGKYTCMATDTVKNVSNNDTVDVYVKCNPVLEQPENVTRSYPPSNDSSVHVEVDVVCHPEPKQLLLFKEAEREKRSPETELAVPQDRYTSRYEPISPGRGKAHMVMVGVSSNDTGKYVFVIKNGRGSGLRYKFRIKEKEEPVRIRQDLGVNVGALVGGVVAAVIVVIVLIVVCIIIKKKDWLLADDDEESKMETKVEIHEFPDSPTPDVKPVLGGDEIEEKKTEDGTKAVV